MPHLLDVVAGPAVSPIFSLAAGFFFVVGMKVLLSAAFRISSMRESWLPLSAAMSLCLGAGIPLGMSETIRPEILLILLLLLSWLLDCMLLQRKASPIDSASRLWLGMIAVNLLSYAAALGVYILLSRI